VHIQQSNTGNTVYITRAT